MPRLIIRGENKTSFFDFRSHNLVHRTTEKSQLRINPTHPSAKPVLGYGISLPYFPASAHSVGVVNENTVFQPLFRTQVFSVFATTDAQAARSVLVLSFRVSIMPGAVVSSACLDPLSSNTNPFATLETFDSLIF